MPGEAELAQAHQWVQEHRWLAAQHSLNQLHRRHPSNAQIRAELARVLLALGDPQRALELLTPCRDQSQWAGLYWRARVRAAATNHHAAAAAHEALQTAVMPAYVLEEWRMIAQGLLQAGWESEAAVWLQALGPWAQDLDLIATWSSNPSPSASTPDLNLDRLSAGMVLHPAPELQRKALAFNQTICQRWLEELPPRLPPRPGPRRRWLLCANDSLPQCWLYRVEQKRQR